MSLSDQESGVSSCQDDPHHDAGPHPPGSERTRQHRDWRPQPDTGLCLVQQDPLLHGHLQRGQEGLHKPLGHARGQGRSQNSFIVFPKISLQAIIGGCACFWGGVLLLGVVYIAVVYIKRNFEPEDVKKKMKRALS